MSQLSQKTPTFNINKFINHLRDPDRDFTIIAFNDLIKFLNTVPEFDLPLETIQNDFLPNVINRLADKTPDIVNPIFRIIVLLSEKLPIASLSSFFEEIFNFVNDPECQIRNQILSVLREVLTNSISFSDERQKNIVNFFINKLNENSDIEILIFNIDIMASLLECLGFQFDENGLRHAKELITTHVVDERLDILPSVASLGKIWMYVAVTNGKQDQFNSMIKQLYEIGKTNSNAYTILSSMVCYKPSIYKDEAVNLHSLFYQRIQVEEEDLAKKQAEDQEIDIYYDTPYVPHITDYISSLTSLVKTFPELYNDDMVDDCISTAFNYLTFGITPSNDDDDEANNENEEDNDDFVIEGGEDGEVIELDEADDEIITGDDSWKIRKTAIALSIALIQCFSERFFESLGFRDEENDCLSVVNTLIKDSDSGSQNDAIEFLKVVIHYYKNNLEEADVFQWFKTLQMQLSSKNNQSIASIIIETITYVLKEYRKIPDDLLVKIITSIQPLLNNNTIQSLLSFVLTIFKVIQPSTSFVSELAAILTDVINNSNISSTIPYIPTISKLFEYAGPIEDSIIEDQKCSSCLKDLASSILSLCASTEAEKIERNMQAFETIGVLIAVFKNDIFGFNDQGMSILVEKFENETSMKILKIVCRSIALIAALPNGKAKLDSYSDRISSKLLSTSFSQIDSSYLFVCLWTFRILLENEIIDPSSRDCQSVAPSLAEIFSSPDPRNVLLSTNIFMQMPTAALKSLNSLKDSLKNQVLDHRIVMSYAELVKLCATQNIKATEEFLISLIDSEYSKADNDKLDDITPNVAFVIGYVAGHINEINEKLLGDFEEKLNDSKEPVMQFVLQCIGEIGALVDLSGRESLVDSIFNLIHHSNREVFNAAAKCVGHLSLKSSNKILPRALAEAKKEKDNTVWILVILSMVKRLPFDDKDKVNFEIDNHELQTIFEFLASNADYNSPTEKSIAESFSCLIKFDPQNYIEKLIELSKDNSPSAPVASHSIALFFEDTAKSDDPYYCFNFINIILSSINLENPSVSEYYIYCLKVCLQIKQQHLNSVSNSTKINPSSEEAFENTDLYDYYDLVCKASVYDPDLHVVEISLGIDTVQKDIGVNLRLNAVNCLILILALYNEKIVAENLFNIAYNIIVNDAKDEVKNQALVLLTKMALDKNILDQLYEIITQRKEVFPEIEEIVYPTGKQKIDLLEENYLRLIIALRITESKKIKEIEEIYSKHKDDPKIKKFESDLSYSVNTPSPFAGILSSGSASASLMKHFYPEAFTIFLI